jgi:DNA-binding response OmpR family regulator
VRTRRLISPTGERVPLTAGEFNLLAAFLQSPKQILSREQLLAASRVHEEEVSTAALMFGSCGFAESSNSIRARPSSS